MRKLSAMVAAAAAALVIAAPASAETLNGDSIAQLVTGKRIYLATPFGGEFPLLYRPDGRVTGDGTALGLGNYLAPKETGKWWIAGNRLCQQWPTWYDGRRTCFELTKVGDNALRWKRDDGRSGKARIGS